MSAPGFLAVGGVEVANNARTATYMQRGLGGPWFQSITANPCPDLMLEAWDSLAQVCPAATLVDQFYANPLGAYRVPNTGALGVPLFRWREAGYFGIIAASQTGAGIGVVLPDAGLVTQTVRLSFDVLSRGSVPRSFYCGKMVNVGTANVGWIGIGILQNAGTYSLCWERRIPNAGAGSVTSQTLATLGDLGITGNAYDARRGFVLELAFTATGIMATVYGGADDATTIIATGMYGFDSNPASSWAAATGQTEAAQLATATEVGIFANGIGFVPDTETVFTSVEQFVRCDAVNATLYPSDTLWPADDLYPQLYGEFHDPGTDNAPWIDTDRPESYDFLGLIIDEIKGLDTSSDRSVDPAADGIGGILGPETLGPRVLDVTGWLISASASGMQYARRWLAETLADSLCAGCDTSYVDVRTTCSDDPAGNFYTNRWTCYEAGLTGMATDVSGQDCDFVTPVSFQITCGDPFLYGPRVFVTSVQLNPAGSDAVPVPFESWLFGQPAAVCVTVADQGIGIDAPIFMFTGAVSGFEGGMAYPSMGTYPSDSLWPSDTLYPSDGSQQWTNDEVPFAFTFSVEPNEAFEIDSSRRKLTRYLPDGSTIDGAPSLKIAAGEVIQWLDTCDGASQDVCAAAFAGCTCDDSAVVTIYTQHRER